MLHRTDIFLLHKNGSKIAYSTKATHARRRGRKRRRMDAPPPGRADGMGMDDALWRAQSRPGRVDGLAVSQAWPATAGEGAPPPSVPSQDLCMASWPGHHGSHTPLRRARKGQGRGSQRGALQAGPVDQTVEDAVVPATTTTAPVGSATLAAAAPIAGVLAGQAPAGDPPLAANPPEPARDSNSTGNGAPEDDLVGATPGSPDPMPCRDLEAVSEVPDTPPAPGGHSAARSGQSNNPSTQATGEMGPGDDDCLPTDPHTEARSGDGGLQPHNPVLPAAESLRSEERRVGKECSW